jgi:hypothetical protein
MFDRKVHYEGPHSHPNGRLKAHKCKNTILSSERLCFSYQFPTKVHVVDSPANSNPCPRRDVGQIAILILFRPVKDIARLKEMIDDSSGLHE